MSRQSRLVAGFINPLTTMLIFANGAFALTAGETNSIVTCVENDRAGLITLNTRRRTPLPAPQVSYLPGEGAEIIMTADFDGLVCNLPTRIIKVNADERGQKGIREIRIGQLQASPPVCRISVVTGDGRALKTLSFKSLPGSLIIHWPVEQSQGPAQSEISALRQPVRYEPPARDGRETELARRDPNSETGQYAVASQPPPPAPSFRSNRSGSAVQSKNLVGSSDFSTERKSQANQPNQIDNKRPTEWIEDPPDLRPEIGTSSLTNSSAYTSRSSEDLKAPLLSLWMEKDPTISDSANAVFRLRIKSEHSLTYSTFRLSNPERYVIDFANCPEIVNAQLPDVQDSEFIRSIRVGQPDDPTKTRLVIDLINEPVAIKEQVQREANLLTIRLSRSVDVADKAATQLSVPSGMSIVLDAGHGGSDPGAQRGDVQEKEITLGIIEKLRRKLEAKGFHIALTRSDDTFVSLEDRVRITNNLQPTLFLSVHINAMESANDIHGIETYYQTDQSRALADAIHENLVTKLDAPDRAVRKARFYVINHTPVPAVLAEVGFISNHDERDKLISSDYQNKVANALEQGVMLYLDKQLAQRRPDFPKFNDSPTYSTTSTYSNNSQAGTMKVGGKSSNTRIAQRKYQFEDSAR